MAQLHSDVWVPFGYHLTDSGGTPLEDEDVFLSPEGEDEDDLYLELALEESEGEEDR